MAKLIVFYSRAGENYFGGKYRTVLVGNTEKVARLLAEKTGADLLRLEQVVPYSDDYRTCVAQAAQDLKSKARPALRNLPETLDQAGDLLVRLSRA